MKIALETRGREFGEQGGVPHHIGSMQYVSGDGSDLISGIENLHPFLGKQKQHVQGRIKLAIFSQDFDTSTLRYFQHLKEVLTHHTISVAKIRMYMQELASEFSRFAMFWPDVFLYN